MESEGEAGEEEEGEKGFNSFVGRLGLYSPQLLVLQLQREREKKGRNKGDEKKLRLHSVQVTFSLFSVFCSVGCEQCSSLTPQSLRRRAGVCV